jgi:murein DD-endopeptidase MepM/ murein hydrolase activator NlpD
MIRSWRFPTLIIAAVVCAAALARTAASQQSSENFTYRPPGAMTSPKDLGLGVQDRRIFFPMITFPLRVGPEAGSDGRPLRAFANSQVYRPDPQNPNHDLDDVNDPRLYVYPWVDTLCESRHQGGPMPVCPKTPRHQGVDIRPNAPNANVFDVVAVADGTVTFVQSSGTSEVNIRFAGNSGLECLYLHLRPGNVRAGQEVSKGDVIGKVSNLMSGGTSIHLHLQCKATHPELGQKINMPIYTSLVVAYRRAWHLPDSVDNDVLLRDPEREIDGGIAGTCTEPQTEPLASATSRSFVGRYLYNCSEMGLAIDAATQKMEIVYTRPKQSLRQAAERKPVLVSGKLTGGNFAGDAINFNLACGDPSFKVAGHVDTNDTAFSLQGDRQTLDDRCNPTNTQHETLDFAKVNARPIIPDPHSDGLNCPFALPPGQPPVVIGGREIPPKSERACNFTAITVPGNLAFGQMPRYIREWPGVRKELLIDINRDQIITFQTAETGVGIWWYWLMRRADNGTNLDKHGFGPTGKPTMAAVARAMAGAERSEEFVRQTYLAPYLTFASEFFGRVLNENEALDLSNSDVRFNLGRTMFRLESGRTPVVNRKQFDCGVALGNDVDSDFRSAGVEDGSANPVRFDKFKGLQFYIDTCPGPGTVTNPADAEAQLAAANQQIQALKAQIVALQGQIAQLTSASDAGTGAEAQLAAANQQIQALKGQIVALQGRIAQLTASDPSHPGTGDLPASSSGTIDLEFASGARLRITGAADAATVSAAVTALVQGERVPH